MLIYNFQLETIPENNHMFMSACAETEATHCTAEVACADTEVWLV